MTQFEEINSFCLYLSSFTALNKKRCLHQIQIFFWLFSLSNMLIKVIFLSISALLSEIVIFWLKRVVFSEFPWKYFKTTWKNSLAVCGSFWGEKQFLLNLFPFTGLIKTVVYTKLFKKNKLSEYFSATFSLFWLKREFFSEFHWKCFKTTEKHSLAVCDSIWGDKQFLFIFVQFYCFEQKKVFTPNPNFLLAFLLIKHVNKSNFSEYFSASFWDSHILTKKSSFQWISLKILQNNMKE